MTDMTKANPVAIVGGAALSSWSSMTQHAILVPACPVVYNGIQNARSKLELILKNQPYVRIWRWSFTKVITAAVYDHHSADDVVFVILINAHDGAVDLNGELVFGVEFQIAEISCMIRSAGVIDESVSFLNNWDKSYL